MTLQIFHHSHCLVLASLFCTLFSDGIIKADIVQSLALTSSSSTSVDKSNLQNDFYIGPYLDGNEMTNITVQVGTNAYLPCKVKQLGNKSVSWVRVRDDHILSVDRITFIADERFQAYFKDTTKEWILQIKYVQARDAGVYECQVSTEPKVSARAHLHVVVPRTELVGDSDRYVKAGSTVVLRCIIRGAIEPPSYIIWYHGSQQLLPDNKQGFRIQMGKDVGPNAVGTVTGALTADGESSTERQTIIGSLLIDSAKKRDSGNYTCSPSNSPPSTVTLHVISSESSASPVKSSACRETTTASRLYQHAFGLVLAVTILCRHQT